MNDDKIDDIVVQQAETIARLCVENTDLRGERETALAMLHKAGKFAIEQEKELAQLREDRKVAALMLAQTDDIAQELARQKALNEMLRLNNAVLQQRVENLVNILYPAVRDNSVTVPATAVERPPE